MNSRLLNIPETLAAQSGQPTKEINTLRNKVHDLSEENNMLKFKVECLLDMVKCMFGDVYDRYNFRIC